jgi:predicted DCC family thiol-disulfide oxidoreductase YuxK
MDNQIVVVYDGQCQFCQASIDWIEQKLAVDSKAFQEAELNLYGLSYDQCSQSVHVIADGAVLAGAPAIAFLLKARGNRSLSLLITASGVFGRWGYRWIATHRISLIVNFAHRLLNQSNLCHQTKRKR